MGGRYRDHQGKETVARVPGSEPLCAEPRVKLASMAASLVGLSMRRGSERPWGALEVQSCGERGRNLKDGRAESRSGSEP